MLRAPSLLATVVVFDPVGPEDEAQADQDRHC